MCFRDVPSRLSSREARRTHGRSPVVEGPRGMQPPEKMRLARALEPPVGRGDAMRTAAGIDGQIVDSPTASTTQDLDAWLVGTSTGREEAPGCISRMAIAGASQKRCCELYCSGGEADNLDLRKTSPFRRTSRPAASVCAAGRISIVLIECNHKATVRFGLVAMDSVPGRRRAVRYGLTAWPSGCRDVAEETSRSSTRSGLGRPRR
jgi:hypothetical protein